MNLPTTFEPVQVDTKSGRVPRAALASPGGLSFYCPCCDPHAGPVLPMIRQPSDGADGLAVFRCPMCPTILTARIVPGVRRRPPGE